MEKSMYIGGQWVAATEGRTFDTADPATLEVLATVPDGTTADVDRAVAAARRAFDSGPWPGTPERERERVLRRIAEALRRDRQQLAELEVRETGKPIAEALAEIDESTYMFDYYAGWPTKATGDIPPVGPNGLSLIVREPVGVAALITPWNFPLLTAAQKVAPALAAGCTCVLKPSKQTPLTALELAAAAEEAGLPNGALNVVTGSGSSTGAPLVRHPGVDKVSFTGSLAVGREIFRAAADRMARVTLELGGKSPNIVFADAYLPAAVEGSILGVFLNQGEVCSAGSRVFVERPIINEFLQALVDRVRRVRLGHGLDPKVTMGPLISAEQRQRVQRYIDSGIESGATVAVAGDTPSDPELANGHFVRPTVFCDVNRNSPLAREEVFGPVMALFPFDDQDEVVKLANDTNYGLAAAVWTADMGRALQMARSIRAGTVWINDSQVDTIEAPWGGFKQSGVGRECGRSGYEEFTELKNIYLRVR